MSISSILRGCFRAKMLIISSKLSSFPYWMCISASPLSLSCPIVERRYVLSRRRTLQWNPSITATIGEWRFGPYREVAFREGSCFFQLFSCSSHISLHPVITLSKRRRLHSLMEQDCNSTETTIVLLNTQYSYHTESHKN